MREERSLIAEKKSYVYVRAVRPKSGYDPAGSTLETATTVAPNKHQPPTRALSHPDRACRSSLSLSPSRKDYMPEKLHTFLMATHGCSPAPVPFDFTAREMCSDERGSNGEVQGENTRHEGRREARAKEPSVTPATSVIYLLPPPPPPPSPRLFFFSCDFARGVIFQRTGKCSHYREKPCGAPARRCTITRQPSVRERRQPVAQTENHARWRTTFPQALA